MTNDTTRLRKGDALELAITKYAFEGKGIAKIIKDGTESEEPNYVVFAHGAYPGDTVKIRLTKIKKSYAEGKVTHILKPSELRIEKRCKYFGVCGGCKQQDLAYEHQLHYKHEQVYDLFTRLGGYKDITVEEIIPSKNIFFYRNKMEFSFAAKRWLTEAEIGSGEDIDRNFALGLHIPNLFDKVLDINECFLQSEISTRILNFTRDFFKSRNVSIYENRPHEGYLRNLVIKQASNTPDLMVNLVTFTEDDELMKEYTGELVKNFPEVTTVINNINARKALVAVGDYEKVYYGSGYIYDYIGKYKFRISANSFFQTNTVQADNLYGTALEFAQLNKDDVVYDLYSGAGTISIYVSEKCKNVYAFETVDSSIADASVNDKLNNIDNVEFVQADLYKSFLPAVEERNIPKPDVVILDPPRSGMHKNTVDDVIALKPKRIVYVSCNPATQVRDVKFFTEAGYSLKRIKPVDMFPHTYHIENVVLLEK